MKVDLDKWDALFVGWIGFLLLLCGFNLGASVCVHAMQQAAIQRGYAEYNATTGQWQWKGEKPEVKE